MSYTCRAFLHSGSCYPLLHKIEPSAKVDVAALPSGALSLPYQLLHHHPLLLPQLVYPTAISTSSPTQKNDRSLSHLQSLHQLISVQITVTELLATQHPLYQNVLPISSAGIGLGGFCKCSNHRNIQRFFCPSYSYTVGVDATGSHPGLQPGQCDLFDEM